MLVVPAVYEFMASELAVLDNNRAYGVALGADFPFLCMENKAVRYRKTSFGYQPT